MAVAGGICMRALVFSDSHGRENMIVQLLQTVKNVDLYVYLGDGEKDIYSPAVSDEIGFKKLVAVAGNCDFGSSLPLEQLVELGPKKILCLHGHSQAVKFGYDTLEHKAKQLGADVAVHGHTHERYCNFNNGLWIMCPGSIKDGEYGIIDLDDRTGSIICYTKNLYF